MANQGRPSRSRITVQTSAPRRRSKPQTGSKGGRTPEVWVAVSVICAATLATFVALFITSRPFDPMSASVAPQQTVPAGPNLSPSPKSSPTTTPIPSPSPPSQGSPAAPAGATSSETPDDSTIQAHIESALAADPSLSKLDVSTLVENGRVTIVGSVKSPEMKQRVEKTVRSVKGVAAIDDQLVISEATP
jgi:BON domain-containing protein